MITFKNETALTEAQTTAIEAEYTAFIAGYIEAASIAQVVIKGIVHLNGTDYAELVTTTTDGGSYTDHFEIK